MLAPSRYFTSRQCNLPGQHPQPKGGACALPLCRLQTGPLETVMSIDLRSSKSMTITKADIVDTVYEKVGITKREASDYVDTIFEVMKETLEDGEEIKVSGFGKFEVREKGERVGRNPRTGIEIVIPERRVLRFKVSQVLKDSINGKR